MISRMSELRARNEMDIAPTEAAGRQWRWWGLAAGAAVGAFDTALLRSLGISFAVNDSDASWFIAVYLGATFAALGFLIGQLLESRRRDRATAALMQAQMEALQQLRARLAQSEKLAALGQLATTIAHEVRNPLGVMRSSAQELAETIPAANSDGRQASSFILAEIDRLNSVISSLLAFARPPRLERRPVALSDLFAQAALLARDELAAKRIRLRTAIETGANGAAALQADPDLLSQVLLGLLSNAAQAVAVEGRIELLARGAPGEVRICVADSGPGVAPELRERIFEPFFTTRPRGTGLGLAVARQIVDAHGGTLSIGDTELGGACFTLRLPGGAAGSESEAPDSTFQGSFSSNSARPPLHK